LLIRLWYKSSAWRTGFYRNRGRDCAVTCSKLTLLHILRTKDTQALWKLRGWGFSMRTTFSISFTTVNPRILLKLVYKTYNPGTMQIQGQPPNKRQLNILQQLMI